MNPIKLGKYTVKLDINKCITCQKRQAKVGRATIVTCIEELDLNFLNKLTDIEKDEIKYRSQSCNSSYKLKAE